jgi:hypothetical protein
MQCVHSINAINHPSLIPPVAFQIPRAISDISFRPNAIAALQIPDSDAILYAAGGLDADVHLSLHSSRFSSEGEGQQRGSELWKFETRLPGSINNSVLLTSMNLTTSYESAVEPKIVISNNDSTVKFYDIPLRGELAPKALRESGTLRLDVPVNHCEPDSSLLSVLVVLKAVQLQSLLMAVHFSQLATRPKYIFTI